jgi:hypothetical protein
MLAGMDLPGEWYFFWLIPSLLSALATLIMMTHILISWKLNHNLLHFQKLCLSFGFFDLIQDIGLILDLWKGICRIQYTLFLTGSFYKSFLATGGLGGLYLIIIHHIIPSNILILKYSILWFLFATFILLILFISDVYHELGCGEESRENLIAVDQVSLTSQLIFGFTYCLFTLLCCLLVTFMSLRILYRFKSYSHFYTFRTTVILYIFIFLFAIVPGCIYLLNLAISHEYHSTILEMTGLSLCSSGWLFSMTYFFLLFSPKIKKIFQKMTQPDFNHPESPQILLSSHSSSPSHGRFESENEIEQRSQQSKQNEGGKNRKKSFLNAKNTLSRIILSGYHDESQWTESGTDPYGLSYIDSHGSVDITHHNHVTNPTTPLPLPDLESSRGEAKETDGEGNGSFHTKLISSLYDIHIETPQDDE